MVTETTKARAPCPEFSEAEVESAGKEVEMPKAASPSRINTNLIYSVEDVPPWYLTLLLGFQHYLTMASGTIAIPILAASFLCLEEDDPARGTLVSTVLVHSGIVTLLQTTFGVRLPIVQGTDFSYMMPVITLLTAVHPPCATLSLANMTREAQQEEWLGRIRDVQGAIATVSVFQITLGFTGLVGMLTRWITPLAIVPTVTLVGISFFDLCGDKIASHWGVSIMTITLIIMFSFYLGNKAVPQSVLNTGGRACFFLVTAGTKMLKCFPVVLAVFLAWGLCAIFTAYDVLAPGSAARTDTKGDLLQRTPWFYVPYPGQWGWPRVTAAGVVSMLGASVASIMESIGDYHACARISGAPSPPISAINRGVFVEGLGCLLAGLLGTGSGTTSCSQNIGVISITKVASRRVVQISGVILIVSGLVGKFGAILVTIPEPVMAGVLVVMFAMITSIGLSSLQQVDLSSSRNLFILGFSIFFGLLLPKWLTRNPESLLGTGWAAFDQVLRVFLLTPMMVGGVVGCVLDNTISGTPEERGLKKEERVPEDSDEECYNLPWITPWIKRLSWMRFLPVCSTYLRKPNLSHQV
ncbi:solute carrier family 23 member 2-like isoform X2 [Portunus trituberculatus]|uniref:solute carrier family 23 member 2-like isoform X2 n=1 Tax=Portunus trituberculatus TaxID=210409 RepID=UPI001E1CCFF5|nr:solute carrier family 23 member 2-like isoform X2 [Portunus trituberculatus]